jgi:CheY-like chemotaxis protein
LLPAASEPPSALALREHLPRQRHATGSGAHAPASDDRQIITSGERVLLIIEDDEAFGRTLLDLVREHGFRGVVAKTGAQGLEFARNFQPSAITLDLRLPDMDGFVVLDQLKRTPATRHIPVHVISGADDAGRGLDRGAIAFLQKPVSAEALEEAVGGIERFLARQVKHLLVVEDDLTQRNSIVELIGGGDDIQVVAVDSGEAAVAELSKRVFDCMVLDLKLPGMSGLEQIQRVKDHDLWKRTPIIVYTGKELTREEDTELRRITDTIIVKDAKSPERLLDETALFLHRVEAKLPNSKRQMLRHRRATACSRSRSSCS